MFTLKRNNAVRCRRGFTSCRGAIVYARLCQISTRIWAIYVIKMVSGETKRKEKKMNERKRGKNDTLYEKNRLATVRLGPARTGLTGHDILPGLRVPEVFFSSLLNDLVSIFRETFSSYCCLHRRHRRLRYRKLSICTCIVCRTGKVPKLLYYSITLFNHLFYFQFLCR